MATAAASRPSGPVLSIPNYGSASPNRVKLAAAGAGVRSPANSVSVSSPKAASSAATRSGRSCMCSPTNHPGSFRCSKHKVRKQDAPPLRVHGHGKPASPSPPVSSGACRPGGKGKGGARVQLGSTVESGTWAKRALAPSPQPQNRRRAADWCRPGPSRLTAVSFAGDNLR